jgi:hypothetical protein
MEKNNHHSFTPGFVLGLFSGVVGYYLFGTPQGEKMRQKLSTEWDGAKKHLIDEGVLPEKIKKHDLKSFLMEAKDRLLRELEIDLETKPSSKARKRTYTHKQKPKQFKGV